jgi:high-affinity iron transporter
VRAGARRAPLAGLAIALATAIATPMAAAAEAPPWRAAEAMQAALFEAQTELLLDAPAAAEGGAGAPADGGPAAAPRNGRSAAAPLPLASRRVRAAARAFRGPLDAALRRDSPAAYRDVRAALRAASAAAAAGDQAALAAARGRLRAAVLHGSYEVTLAAVRRGDAATAARWLLLREFRKATRFTRPGVDATNAVRQLGRRAASPARTGLAVRKDLLDAYQARLLDELEEAAGANAKDFGARRAEAAAIAAGYFGILAEEYGEQRGRAALDGALTAFRRLGEAGAARGDVAPGAAGDGAAGDRSAFNAALAEARGVLDGFTAAPFTQAEQARRAQQLVRFLDLVPIEYRDGTDDGRVTIPFEIQEAIAFRDGAEAAFADLEAELERRDARDALAAERALERLEVYVEEAGSGRGVVDEDEVEAAHEQAAELLDVLFPDEWKESDSQADFDLVDLTLDRMEAAAAAGEWKQAEQARLEAYAFFEFGPELSLRSLAPDVVARVEGLVWFGADGEEGLAQLIARERPARDLRESRLALDEALRDGAGALGEGAGTTTVVTNAAVIVFREGLEAVLILAAVMASLLGAARRHRRPMLVGAALALVATAVTFVLAQTVLTSLARYGEKLEAIVGLVAIGVLLLVLNWFFHRVYWTEHLSRFHKRRKRLVGLAEGGLWASQGVGFVLLGFSTVYREGFETVLFLQALELNSGLFVVLQGVALGGAAVLAVAFLTFKLERRLPYRRMLIVTGVLLTAVLVIMVGKTARIMQGVGWIPITPLDFEPPYWAGVWLGMFPTLETIAVQVGAAVFVVGSYLVAERIRTRGRRIAARATPAPATTPAPTPASARQAQASRPRAASRSLPPAS